MVKTKKGRFLNNLRNHPVELGIIQYPAKYPLCRARHNGYFCYRATRIPDLYPHPANPVTDIVVSDENNTLRLEFSADPTLTYVVEASTDLANWTAIGSAVEEGGAGNFEFDDLNAGQFKARFYRVVTQ